MQTATDYRQAVVRRSSPEAYGAIGIANITLVGVMERTGEIGLRRAMGATRGHIAAQFLFESASMGVIGGIIGASVGILIVAAVSAYQVWTPVLDVEVPLLAPLVGGPSAPKGNAYRQVIRYVLYSRAPLR